MAKLTRPDRKTITDLYVRVCADSQFTIDATKAMMLTADILGIHPLEVGYAMPSISVAESIAAGREALREASHGH